MTYPVTKEIFVRRAVDDVLSINDKNIPAEFMERLQDVLGLDILLGYATVKLLLDYLKSKADIVDDKVNKSGDTMSGNLNMGSNDITNISEILSSSDLQIKSTEAGITLNDLESGTYLWLTEDLITNANLAMGNKNITAVNLVDGRDISEDLVKVEGDTMSGDLEMTNTLNGIIFKDRTTSVRYRLKVDNGILGVEAV